MRALRGDQEETYVARFVFFCSGYYDYDRPHDPGFVGIEDFRGQVLHPQSWPADTDLRGKRVVVIGSGATAVTVVPALAAQGAEVTMLQRTPTYVLAQSRTDGFADVARRLLPATTAHRLVRAKNIALQWTLVQACRRFPGAMRSLLRKGVIAGTGSADIADAHFAPPYDPWDQRLCIAPDGDLFRALGEGRATVVTDTIDRFVADGIVLSSGRKAPADAVVTATGLRIRLLGGVRLSLDGEPIDLSRSYTWHGAMLSGIPNLGVCIGYINLSWTVRADITARLLARIVRRVRETGVDAVVPVAPPDLGEGRPFMDMSSGYLARAAHLMPRATSTYPWAIRQDVVVDGWRSNRADLDDGLAYTRVDERVPA